MASNGRKTIKIMVSLKYLRNFWRTLALPLINCEINNILTCFPNRVKASNNAADQETKFKRTDTKLYVPVVTLSSEDNAKLLRQLKSDFKSTIQWDKYQGKLTT